MASLTSLILGGVQLIAGAVLLATGLGAGVGVKLLLSGALTLVSSFLSGRTGRSGYSSSPTYGFDSLSNQQQEGAPVPVIYGEHQIAPAVISVNLKTEGDGQVLYLLLLVGEGEIEGIHSIRLNDEPLESYPDVTATTKYGTSDQEAIPDFDQIGLSYDAGTALEHQAAHVHEMRDTADELVLALVWQAGFYKLNDDGDVDETSATLKIEYKAVGAADSTYAPLSPASDEKSWMLEEKQAGTWQTWHKSMSAVRKQIRLRFDGVGGRPARGRYTVRVTGANVQKSDRQRTATLTSVIEVQNEQRAYANRALLALKIPAQEQLSGSLPRVTCVVKGRKVYDPRSATTSWSRNPVLCARDLLLSSRYGLGDHLTSADLDEGVGGSWRTMADACDATVTPPDALSSEARYCLDYVLDVKAPASDHLQQMLQTARMTMFAADGLIRVAQDAAGASVRTFEARLSAAVADRRNILDGSDGRLTLTVKHLDASQRHNVVRLQYLDAAKGWRKRVIEVRDTRVAIGAITGGPFQAGEKIKGATSKAIGRVVASFATGAPVLVYTQDDGATAFASGETIAGLTSGASCTASAAPYDEAPERALEMQLFGITRRTQAVREARYHLQRAQRTPLFASWGVALGDLDVLPGDVVTLAADYTGWSAQKATVLSTGFSADGVGVIEAREYDPDVYVDGVDTSQFDRLEYLPGGSKSAAIEAAKDAAPATSSESIPTTTVTQTPPATVAPPTAPKTPAAPPAPKNPLPAPKPPPKIPTQKSKTKSFDWNR